MLEEYRIVSGYTQYQVSNLGNVKSFKRCSKGRLLKPHLTRDGYARVDLTINKTKRAFNIHKLVQTAFELGEGFIDHINGIRDDNELTNLRVVTRRENSQNRVEHRKGKIVGASYIKNRSHLKTPWRAAIWLKGKNINLGYFETELKAHKVYMDKHREITEEECNGSTT